MKIIIVFFLIISVMFTVLACGNSRYNNNFDISTKIVGSKSFFVDSIIPENMDQVVAHATDIIIGTVTDDGSAGTYSYSGIKEIDEKFAEITGSSKLICTLSNIEVEQVVMGDIQNGSTIVYFQIGTPGDNQGQTKVKKGDHILIMLRSSDSEGVYFAGNGEESVFYLDKNNRLTSQSDFAICARYDGISLDILIEDIKATRQFAAIANITSEQTSIN